MSVRHFVVDLSLSYVNLSFPYVDLSLCYVDLSFRYLSLSLCQYFIMFCDCISDVW